MRTIEDRQSKRVGIGLAPPIYDKVTVLYPDSTTETYVYTLRDAAGTAAIVGYVEVKYVDATKEEILSVERLAE
jgi:hypothetical protein